MTTQTARAGRSHWGPRSAHAASAGWFWVRRNESRRLYARRPCGGHGLQAGDGQSCL